MVTNEFADIEKSSIVSESIVAYDKISTPNCLRIPETFEHQWQRALTVEDFRKRCKRNLRAIYG